MAQESEKKALIIAFLVSLTVSLIVTPLYMYGGQLIGGECEIVTPCSLKSGMCPLKATVPGKGIEVAGIQEKNMKSSAPAGMSGMPHRRRDGGFSMRPASPELLALYKERAEMYQKIADFIAQQVKAAGVDQVEAIKAAVARDEAKLAYWRREKNMRPANGATEAFIHVQAAKKILQLTEANYKANTIPLVELNKVKAKAIDAEIQLGEALLFVRDKDAWKKAAKPLESYPDNVTDALLRALLALEQPGAPR